MAEDFTGYADCYRANTEWLQKRVAIEAGKHTGAEATDLLRALGVLMMLDDPDYESSASEYLLFRAEGARSALLAHFAPERSREEVELNPIYNLLPL